MQFEDFAIAASTSDLSLESEAREYADFIEFQLQLADSPTDQLEAYSGDLPLIVTLRETTESSGCFSHFEELKRISTYSDVEFLDTPLSLSEKEGCEMEELKKNATLIVSYYDTSGTPPSEELEEIIERCSTSGDYTKLSTKIRDRSESLRFLELVSSTDSNGINIIGDPTDENGLSTKMLALFHGSRIGYAPIHADNEANGDVVDVEELYDIIYEIEHGADDVEITKSLQGRF